MMKESSTSGDHEENKTLLGNLWLSLLNWAGCPAESFTDSDGRLTEKFG